jgi:hypothetical protein
LCCDRATVVKADPRSQFYESEISVLSCIFLRRL